jgi:AhpC/TSA antioxidant enzyme
MESLTQLREKLPEFEKLSVGLGCVVQGTAAEAEEVCGQFGMADKCVPDPEKESYAKFGLDRTTLGAMVFASEGLKARRRENRAAGFSVSIKKSFMPHCDIFLLPGAALVAPGGRILWLHRGAHPGDLPSADELVNRVRQNLQGSVAR